MPQSRRRYFVYILQKLCCLTRLLIPDGGEIKNKTNYLITKKGWKIGRTLSPMAARWVLYFLFVRLRIAGNLPRRHLAASLFIVTVSACVYLAFFPISCSGVSSIFSIAYGHPSVLVSAPRPWKVSEGINVVLDGVVLLPEAAIINGLFPALFSYTFVKYARNS